MQINLQTTVTLHYLLHNVLELIEQKKRYFSLSGLSRGGGSRLEAKK